MSKNLYNIPMDQIMSLQTKLANNREMDKLAKGFIYDENESMARNLKLLGDLIVKHFELSPKIEETLRQYLAEKNIPIEVNFKPLRAEQLVNIIEEWISLHTESSTIVQKIYTMNHRNILFKRVLFEEKENIDDYFSTLSDRNMLKAVDLYQLLVDILSNYHLYENSSDSETFFEKVNSFNVFVEIVERFVNSAKRIYLGTKREDFQYVRRIQFQRLIEFWEQQNQQLTLLSERRINKISAETQTIAINVVSSSVQTGKQAVDLLQFINNSLQVLNKMTCSTNKRQELLVIEQLYSALRKGKINLMSSQSAVEENSNMLLHVFPEKPLKIQLQNDSISNFSETFGLMDKNESGQKAQNSNRLLNLMEKVDLEMEIARTVTPQKKVKEILIRIYNSYKQGTIFSKNTLEQCLIDIGIIQSKLDPKIDELVRRKFIKNKHMISFEEFKVIINHLMQIDQDLTYEVLEEFLKARQSQKIPIGPSSSSQYLQAQSDRVRRSSFNPKTSRSFYGKYINQTMHY